MAFRKRNVGLSTAQRTPPLSPASSSSAPPASRPSADVVSRQDPPPVTSPGIRPSPLDGRPVTSTGTATLDTLLAGHSGLPLGSSLLIEETGTTDYAGTLLRYYAAEGIVQGHIVHVVGVGEQWGRDLPGCTGVHGGAEKVDVPDDQGSKARMKIAWRYERLGDFGASKTQRGMSRPASCHTRKANTCQRRPCLTEPSSSLPPPHPLPRPRPHTHPPLRTASRSPTASRCRHLPRPRPSSIIPSPHPHRIPTHPS